VFCITTGPCRNIAITLVWRNWNCASIRRWQKVWYVQLFRHNTGAWRADILRQHSPYCAYASHSKTYISAYSSSWRNSDGFTLSRCFKCACGRINLFLTSSCYISETTQDTVVTSNNAGRCIIAGDWSWTTFTGYFSWKRLSNWPKSKNRTSPTM